ncbi:MAG: D-alanyl-D-alanine carboxypeptidase/D-alanyl-D-alanine-endopeptidase [Ignavibacteriaceae bacterium]
MKVKINLFLLLIFFTAVLAAQEKSKDTLSVPKYSGTTIKDFWKELDDIFNDPNFDNANWGVVIQSLETGEYFYRRNANKLFIPASDLKLFTTSAALILLGPEYSFSTDILINGKMDGSVLDGDLIVRGRGDPTISGRFYDDDKYKVFKDWSDSLTNIGIDEITGNIIGDDNRFDNLGLGKGWAWDDESYWFSAPSGAISFNDNVVDIVVKVNNEKNIPVIKTSPSTKYIVFINNVSVVPDDSTTSINVYRQRGTNIVDVFGTIRRQDSVKTYVTVNNPTQYSMVVLKSVLQKKDINVDGFAMDIDDISKLPADKNLKPLFTYYSPPLKEIIKVINKNSENFYSEQLLKTIGLEKEGFGSADNGVKAEDMVFREMGILPEGMNIVDGSGLSRLNLVSPHQIVTLLNYMFKSKYFIPFFNSLPIAGVDGTIGKRMKKTKAENNLRAKTGTHIGVSSISGFVYTLDNEPISFSIIANNYNVPVKIAENIEDLVCLRLANFKRK